MKESPLISLLLSTRGKGPEVLAPTLDSILNSISSDYELILVDQNNDYRLDGVFSFYREKHPDLKIHLFRQDKSGLSVGRNYGLSMAQGDWIILVDDDAIYSREAMDAAAAFLINARSEPAIFFGRAINLENGETYLSRRPSGDRLSAWSFDGACSIELIIHRGVFEKIGTFDEAFGAGSRYPAGEEADLLIRAIQSGISIRKFEGFTIKHPVWPVDPGRKRFYGYGLGALYRKHLGSFPVLLSVKAAVEIFGRLGIGLLNFPVRPRVGMSHLNYLQGFMSGLLTPVSPPR